MSVTVLACVCLGTPTPTIIPSVPGKCADCDCDIQYAASNLPMITSGRAIPVCIACVMKRVDVKPPSDIRATLHGKDVSLAEAAGYWQSFRERN